MNIYCCSDFVVPRFMRSSFQRSGCGGECFEF